MPHVLLGFVAVGILAVATVGCSHDPSAEAVNASSSVSTSRIGTAAGYFLVQGEILDKYQQSGGPSGWLGQPTSNEKPGPNAGRFNEFQHGAIYWTPQTGAHCIAGQVLWTWNANGGPAGPLGYPSTDPTTVPGGTISHFEHGTVSEINGQTHVDSTNEASGSQSGVISGRADASASTRPLPSSPIRSRPRMTAAAPTPAAITPFTPGPQELEEPATPMLQPVIVDSRSAWAGDAAVLDVSLRGKQG